MLYFMLHHHLCCKESAESLKVSAFNFFTFYPFLVNFSLSTPVSLWGNFFSGRRFAFFVIFLSGCTFAAGCTAGSSAFLSCTVSVFSSFLIACVVGLACCVGFSGSSAPASSAAYSGCCIYSLILSVWWMKIGRAHVWTPVTPSNLVCRIIDRKSTRLNSSHSV